jgi:hypothetical protein
VSVVNRIDICWSVANCRVEQRVSAGGARYRSRGVVVMRTDSYAAARGFDSHLRLNFFIFGFIN